MTDPIAFPAPNTPRAHVPEPIDKTDPVWEQAVKLEALLFTQLLDVAGVGGLSPLGGEDDGPASRFDSMLREQHARAVAGSDATGLARQLYRELKGL